MQMRKKPGHAALAGDVDGVEQACDQPLGIECQ